MQYRIKYTIWRIEAENSAEAKKAIVEMLRRDTEKFVSVEPAHDKRPMWKMFLFG